MLVLFTQSDQAESRIAFTVTRKVGNAVVRNRVKRWLREAIRHQLPLIPDFKDVVVIAHPQAAKQGLHGLSSQLSTAWKNMREVA